MPNWPSNISQRSARNCAAVAVTLAFAALARPAHPQTTGVRAAGPSLHAAQIIELTKYLSSTDGPPDVYSRVVKAAFDVPQGDAIKLTAYEENRSFVYAVAGMEWPAGLTTGRPPTEKPYRWIRRLIILNPSVLVLDDEIPNPGPSGVAEMCMASQTTPQVSGRVMHVKEASGEITWELLFPRKAEYQLEHAGAAQEPGSHLVRVVAQAGPPVNRFLQVLRVGEGSQAGGAPQSELTTAGSAWKLTVTSQGKSFRLTLPPASSSAGEINITATNGKILLAGRPFPSGILPHGPEGDRLLELWDSDYQQKTPAAWDIGRPADELQKVVKEGKVPRCRAVDVCCGSGTDAIYLASRGFDVTAIDVAPTALGQAQEKARKAGVTVNWVLADILATPEMKPFDFIYDRGCYHVVRDQNLNAYLETVRRLTHPGSRFLLLAARRDEQTPGNASGVSEEELRFDFLNLFDVEWLREIKLESNRPGPWPPGWSAMLKRNTTP